MKRRFGALLAALIVAWLGAARRRRSAPQTETPPSPDAPAFRPVTVGSQTHRAVTFDEPTAWDAGVATVVRCHAFHGCGGSWRLWIPLVEAPPVKNIAVRWTLHDVPRPSASGPPAPPPSLRTATVVLARPCGAVFLTDARHHSMGALHALHVARTARIAPTALILVAPALMTHRRWSHSDPDGVEFFPTDPLRVPTMVGGCSPRGPPNCWVPSVACPAPSWRS